MDVNPAITEAIHNVYWLVGTALGFFSIVFGIVVRFLYIYGKDMNNECNARNIKANKSLAKNVARELNSTRSKIDFGLNAMRFDFQKGLDDAKDRCSERREHCNQHICGKITTLEKRVNAMESTMSIELKTIGEAMVEHGKNLVKIAEHMKAVDARLAKIEIITNGKRSANNPQKS